MTSYIPNNETPNDNMNALRPANYMIFSKYAYVGDIKKEKTNLNMLLKITYTQFEVMIYLKDAIEMLQNDKHNNILSISSMNFP